MQIKSFLILKLLEIPFFSPSSTLQTSSRSQSTLRGEKHTKPKEKEKKDNRFLAWRRALSAKSRIVSSMRRTSGAVVSSEAEKRDNGESDWIAAGSESR